jgi:hypothetical protein
LLDDPEEVEDVDDGGDADEDVTDAGEVHGVSIELGEAFTGRRFLD